MQELDVRAAAETASRLVNQKLQLQNLHDVLEDLAGQQNLARELKASVSDSRAELERLRNERAALESAHATRVKEIEDDLGARKAVAEGELERLKSECDAASKRRAELAELADREEKRLARVRAALASAASTVGVA